MLALRIVAAVEHDGESAARFELRAVGHLRRRNQVAAPHLGAVELELARHAVEQALHHEHALRMAGAAHRRHRHLVGEREPDVHAVGRQLVAERHVLGGVVRQVDTARRVGAVIVYQRAADAEQARLVIDRHFDIPVLVALLRRGDEMLEAVLDPFHRPLQQYGRQAGDDILRVEDQLRAEPAADVGRDDAYLVLVAPEHVAKEAHRSVRHLRRAPERKPVVQRVMQRDGAAAFDRMAAAAVLPERFAEDMRRFLECRVDIAVGHVELGEQVVRRLAMHQRRAGGERRAAVRGRGQRLVVDVDERRCVFGNVAIIGDHDRHGLADMHHFVARERRTIQILLIARARQADDHELGGEVRHDVGAREDGVHAR